MVVGSESRYYGVRRGLSVRSCIFFTWQHCQPHVEGFDDAEYGVFPDLLAAVTYVKSELDTSAAAAAVAAAGDGDDDASAVQLREEGPRMDVEDDEDKGATKGRLETETETEDDVRTEQMSKDKGREEAKEAGRAEEPVAGRNLPSGARIAGPWPPAGIWRHGQYVVTPPRYGPYPPAPMHMMYPPPPHLLPTHRRPAPPRRPLLHPPSGAAASDQEGMQESSPAAKKQRTDDAVEKTGGVEASLTQASAGDGNPIQKNKKKGPGRPKGSKNKATIEKEAVAAAAAARGDLLPQKKKRAVPDWETRLEELKRYKAKHGHCNVPQKYSENKQLGTWVGTQRTQYGLLQRGEKSCMSEERIDALESLGFEWVVSDTTGNHDWESRLEQLRQYKAKHGHCNSSGSLGSWAKDQRYQYELLQEGKESTMSEEQINSLESLGFKWTVTAPKEPRADWDTRFEELRQYKAEHGHCNVPYPHKYSSEYKQLGLWVSNQRRQYLYRKKGERSYINDERIAALESLGFEWIILPRWETSLEELKQYNAKHGHCNVPAGENKQLCEWVNTQRKYYKLRMKGEKSPMSDERVAALESLGFKWVGRCSIKAKHGYGAV